MIALSHYCLRHTDRPAVARCPSCGQSFCRECVAEHDSRLLCADCLRKQSETLRHAAKAGWLTRLPLAAALQLVAGLAILWGLFYLTAGVLRRLPADIHEGHIWTK